MYVTLGIIHIYNCICFKITGIEKFDVISNVWIEKTLKMTKFDDGLARYKAWKSEKYSGWINDYGILEGIAGIGLALIASISDFDPKRDECLLLS